MQNDRIILTLLIIFPGLIYLTEQAEWVSLTSLHMQFGIETGQMMVRFLPKTGKQVLVGLLYRGLGSKFIL